MTMVHALLLAILFALVPGAAIGDEDFLAMRDAFRARDQKRLDALAPRLKGHVLEPYAAYWRLRNQLAEAEPETVRAFLAEYKDTFVAERMRADWLKRLGKEQQWALFETERAGLAEEDAEIICYGLQARARGDARAAREARPLWFSERNLPEGCLPLVAMLAASGQLSERDVWARVRSSLAAGQTAAAVRASELLPAGPALNTKVLSAVSQNPAAHLARSFDAGNRAVRETTMFAAYRLARTSPQQAAMHWANMESRFTAEERAFVWGQIGLQGALKHDPEALTWYAKAGDMSDYQLEWQARAALRAGDWKTLIAAVDAMVKENQDAPWRYWKARALKVLGREAEALALLKPLSQEFSFYGQLALEELGGKISTPVAVYTPSAAEVQAMSQTPGVRRALTLYALGMRVEANREWMWTIRGFDDRKLLAAAEVARRSDIPDRVINTAEKTVATHDFRLRYFAPYRDVLKVHAARHGLDEAWVLGLIRQESRFMADVRSSAGASGLMQLMPGTAKWVANRMGLKNWRWGDVNDVDTNISLGTYYLRHVYDYLDGSAVLASAAYNAGPGRARAWRPDRPMESAAWAETIPFNETRHYVKLVMANASYYAHLLTQQVQSLRGRIGEVTPKPAEEKGLGDTP